MSHKKQQNNLAASIIHTLSYAALFEYPLTLSEIHQYLIQKKSSLFAIGKEISNIPTIEKSGEYYFFKKKSLLVEKREMRQMISQGHLKEAFVAVGILSYIPTIEAVALSGSLAMNNSDVNSDIDLFIITKPHTLWVTRLITTLLLDIAGKRRKKGMDENMMGMVCTNYWIDRSRMKISNKNLYTAHEIAQMKVLINKSDCWSEFLSKNKWVGAYLPNTDIPQFDMQKKEFKSFFSWCIFGVLGILNFGAFIIQYAYMKRSQTQEKVTLFEAKFHPRDNTNPVLNAYKKECTIQMDAYSKKGKIRLGRLLSGISAVTITPGS